jgi:hypothetical protein
MARKPRPGTEQEKRTALAAQYFADYLNSVPTETGGVRDQERADGHLAKMRELLEQNAAEEPEES